MTALRMAADSAWAEVQGLRADVEHAMVLNAVSDACRRHTDDAYAAYVRARERAVAIEQLAEHAEGGYNPWTASIPEDAA
jgi:hypothetical protein